LIYNSSWENEPTKEEFFKSILLEEHERTTQAMDSKNNSGDANKQPEKGTGWAAASVTKPFETAPVSFQADKYEFRRNISSQPVEPRAGDNLEVQRALYNREV
jgi:hypothetical protein